MARKKPISEQLRQAVRESELSRYAISKQTGIAESNLARFVNDDAGLSLASIDTLCEALGLALTKKAGK